MAQANMPAGQSGGMSSMIAALRANSPQGQANPGVRLLPNQANAPTTPMTSYNRGLGMVQQIAQQQQMSQPAPTVPMPGGKGQAGPFPQAALNPGLKGRAGPFPQESIEAGGGAMPRQSIAEMVRSAPTPQAPMQPPQAPPRMQAQMQPQAPAPMQPSMQQPMQPQMQPQVAVPRPIQPPMQPPMQPQMAAPPPMQQMAAPQQAFSGLLNRPQQPMQMPPTSPSGMTLNPQIMRMPVAPPLPPAISPAQIASAVRKAPAPVSRSKIVNQER